MHHPHQKETSPFINGASRLATFLNVHPRTIQRLLRKHALPAIRLGKRYLFRITDVEEFLARHTIPALGTKRRSRVKDGPLAVSPSEEAFERDTTAHNSILSDDGLPSKEEKVGATADKEVAR